MNDHQPESDWNDEQKTSDQGGHSSQSDRPQVRRLYRSSDQRMISGVCGGLGEYFDIDPNLVRLIFVLLLFFGGSGILLYIALAIILPDERKLDLHPRQAVQSTLDEAVTGTRDAVAQAWDWVGSKRGRNR